jgi:2-hydroxy-3-keto-5-methylthiopentenyl-1-phosphate phosphatase
MPKRNYRAAVSSDWSECLSPNGPFDPIAFIYTDLREALSQIFRDYTGNKISLRAATDEINILLPHPFSIAQMDAYLDASFNTYQGVSDLINWCAENKILFMINSTGTQGYFQRALAKGLIPDIPIICANRMISFPEKSTTDKFEHEIMEIYDKPKNTQAVIRQFGLKSDCVVVIGDSGGDGPHFSWAAHNGALSVASMVKPSLVEYCERTGVGINHFFGMNYAQVGKRDENKEMQFNFMDLAKVIAQYLKI